MRDEIKSYWEERHTLQDEGVKSYDEYLSEKDQVVIEEFKEIEATVSSLNIRKCDILDIGGCKGYNLKFLFDDTNSKYLIHISEKSVKYAKKYLGISNSYAIDFIHDDLPFNKSFDVITSFDVIEHIHPLEIQEFVKKIHGLLKPDGVVIITTPNILSLQNRVRIMLGKNPLFFVWDKTHITPLTMTDLN